MKFAVRLFVFAALFSCAAVFAAENSTATYEDYIEDAKAGDARAQYNVALCYFKGDGVDPSLITAFDWFKKSADQDYGNAECFMGLCYYFGKGVKQDYKKAFEYFSRAAEKDIPEAQFNLGVFYETGKGGVTQNIEKAKEYYNKAAKQEHTKAKEAYDKLQKPRSERSYLN